MNREIKFRSWKAGYMDYNPPLYGINNVVEINNISHIENTIFMQFTGLKDKNGKEIYEGDIVKMVLDKIIPRYAICEVKWHEEYAGFNFSHVRLENVVNSGEGWSMSTHDNWEVIGNIYENPELLTPNKQ